MMETVIAHSDVRCGEASPTWVYLNCQVPSDVAKTDDRTLVLSTPNAVSVRFFVQKDGRWVEDSVRTVDLQCIGGTRKITLILANNDPGEQELRDNLLMIDVSSGEYVGVYESLPSFAG